MHNGVVAVLVCAILALPACSNGGIGSVDTGQDYVTACMFENSVPGSYESPAGVAVPTVTPAEGGTPEGAATLNACIQRKAAQDGVQSSSAQQPLPDRDALLADTQNLALLSSGTRSPLCGAGDRGLVRGTLYC